MQNLDLRLSTENASNRRLIQVENLSVYPHLRFIVSLTCLPVLSCSNEIENNDYILRSICLCSKIVYVRKNERDGHLLRSRVRVL